MANKKTQSSEVVLGKTATFNKIEEVNMRQDGYTAILSFLHYGVEQFYIMDF